MTKVYCKNCKYFSWGNVPRYCNSLDGFTITDKPLQCKSYIKKWWKFWLT